MTKWFTTPLESITEGGNLIMATVRKDVASFQTNPKFKYRVEVSWPYKPADQGMPSESDGELMEQVVERLEMIFHKDPIAVLTEIYTGESVRDMVFYTLSLHIFQRKFNEALTDLPILPLEFSAEEDSRWDEYSYMLKLAESVDNE